MTAGKHGASWLYDFIASQLIGVALTMFCVVIGVGGYKPDDSRVDQAAVVAVRQAGSSEIAEGYGAFAREVERLKDWSFNLCPEVLREHLSKISIGVATAALVGGCLLMFARAPSRAHALRDLGGGIAFPGVFAVLATAVLEWRAMKGIRATLTGDRSASVLVSEGRSAAVEAFRVLAVPLVVGVVLFAIALVLHRRWKREHGDAFTARHVASHFLGIAGLVPWIHLVGTILLEAFTEGASTGAVLAPWADNRTAYTIAVSLFSFGAALFVAARKEVKRIEAATDEREPRASTSK
jgi:hypothetical protein